MDIAILNYPTGEVDILRGIDEDFVSTFFADDIGLYLEDSGYKLEDISYMAMETININENDYETD